MGPARGPRRVLPAGGAIWLGRPDLYPYLCARAGAGASFPDQPVRPPVRGDLRLESGEGGYRWPKVIDGPYDINPAGFTIHSAIHAAREDAQCVLHLHSRNGVAVAAQRNGVLPISQHSTLVLASLAYHDYEGLALNEDEKPRLVRDLGDKHFFMLRNHGLLTVGETVADAFLYMYVFETTCAIQVQRKPAAS